VAWDFRDFSPFAAVLLDLDGTIFHEDQVLPGAVELVRRLQREGRNFACLSNSTTSPQRLQHRLGKMGLDVPAERIYTACAAAAAYALEHFGVATKAKGIRRARVTDSSSPATRREGKRRETQKPHVFNLGTKGFHDMLEGKVVWANGAEDACDGVVCGALTCAYVTEERMRAALTILRRQSGSDRPTALLGMCADRVYPSPRGLEFGSGAMTTMMSYASGVPCVFTGKPEVVFFEELCGQLGVEARKCLLIGDNLESDIRGARRMGMRSLLILTGVTQEKDLLGLNAGERPDGVVKGLLELA